MARYFIDTSDEEIFCRDAEGWEFPDLEAARHAAVAALPDIAKEMLGYGTDTGTVSAIVRDANGNVRVEASLTLNVTRLEVSEAGVN
jgi:hypothetical protein